jgi:alpha-ketoglutaric semialdehyde dehydrogenase
MSITTTKMAPVLIGGHWRQADSQRSFQALNPQTRQDLPATYPVSRWADCEAALSSAATAFREMRRLSPDQTAGFLEDYATRIERRSNELCEMANAETALPVSPRLQDIELPRTSNQLRQAARAARDRSWRMATIDTQANIRSWLAPIGPVFVLGPNNFPFAFGSASGGDFAAAIAAGNPVIAKANSSHPGTTRLLVEEAHRAAQEAGMPSSTIQLIYRLSHDDGERFVQDSRLGACGYTGSRSAGLRLKASADGVGKPIYLELSSLNPVIVLPGSLEERLGALAEEFTSSCLMGTGQFCTNPGLVLLLAADVTEAFIADVAERFSAAPIGTLLSVGVENSLRTSVDGLVKAGATLLTNGERDSARCCYPNTILRVDGRRFLQAPDAFQSEAFGNASLFVVAADVAECTSIIERFDGNLTGCIYSHTDGRDDESYAQLAAVLRPRVGRLLNDKMPTGVAVSSAMNHGGPFPATGNPIFTSVGIPAALTRFCMLQCYDNVRESRLPECLQSRNPTGSMWRLIDGEWTRNDLDGIPSDDHP